jgi:Winged helix DNA-binding domain
MTNRSSDPAWSILSIGVRTGMTTLTLRQMNRWTLARQMLLERTELDPVTAIERLAGMQAQHSPSPYIGLWSRLHRFQREELQTALLADAVFKATLMRGTLHLVSARDYDRYRVATHSKSHIYSKTVRALEEIGVDVDAIRAEVLAAVAAQRLRRREIEELVRHRIPPDLPDYAGWSTVALSGELVNVADDAHFGYFGGGRYRPSPPRASEQADASRHLAGAYFAAFGPATRADLSQWSGEPVSAFSEALNSLDLVSFRAEDGRTVLDLPDAPRPEADIPAPVRFLPKWDNLLLAYERRERVLPEPYRRIVIRKNGDVLPTFLVDGVVAGTWEAPLRGRALLTLIPLESIGAPHRTEIEEEGSLLLAWLRPDTDRRELRWAPE